ncbi:MAG: SIMPL domain-containing protein [Bacteroidia bacterium]|nr:SIMPL domain-containing protein [Bacteroidia bacterium]
MTTQNTNNVKHLIIASAIILSAFLISNAWITTHNPKKTIYVTGLAQKDFTSDLIVWNAKVSRFSNDLKEANKLLNNDIEKIKKFLSENSIQESEYHFTPIQINREYDNKYNENGTLISTIFKGFTVSQNLVLESKNVSVVEKMISKIGEIINEGIEFDVAQPDYFYTKLSDLKIKLLEEATKDAQTRAETIAKNGGSQIGKLKNATMGVFQITAQNSNESYDWGGSFNTKSKNKTASITVRLEYEL